MVQGKWDEGYRCAFSGGMGNLWGGMGKKKDKKKKGKNPWESEDGSGVPSWAQEVPWSDDGLGAESSAEEQFEESDKEKVMEDHREAMGSGHIDALVEMDLEAVERMLMRCWEKMTGYRRIRR